MSCLVTLQRQFAWGWSPACAALGMLPQVVVLLSSGRFVGPFVQRVGLARTAWLSAAAMVLRLAVVTVAGLTLTVVAPHSSASGSSARGEE